MSISADDIRECWAEPGASNIIDAVHPVTGRTLYGNKTDDEMKAERPQAVRMLMSAWLEQRAEQQHGPITWHRTTERQYRDMLEVLPPAMWSGGAFLVGEPDTHSARDGAPMFQCYRQSGQQFFYASRAMTRAELREYLDQKGIAK